MRIAYLTPRGSFRTGKFSRRLTGESNAHSQAGKGGARDEVLPKQVCSGARTRIMKTCPLSVWSRPIADGSSSAGNPPAGIIRVRNLSTAACLTSRFDGLDSSISCPMACRSSVAETTGNSSIRMQPKSTMGRIRSKHRRFLAQANWLRHIQMAGSASVNQRRFNSNSIIRRNSLNKSARQRSQRQRQQ